ncbi:MAG: hypothetical protein CME63_16075 [Halobacteriovoraceae bacterium]|nr:hypothetical protein [Halobacteriovoraceae bacterium]|tara:strand:- start:93247 stop:95634 length:2388 start_codon:yes stop_codon:yes gene_type:complete
MFTKLIRFYLLLIITIGLYGCGGGQAEDPSLRSINDINPEAPNYAVQITSPANLTTYTPASPTSFNLQGICLADGTIEISLNATPLGATSCSSNLFSLSINRSILNEGLNSLTASYTISSLTTTILVRKDTTAPSLTITANPINQSNQTSYAIQGTCSEEGALISGNLQGIPFSDRCTGGVFSSSPMDLSFLADSTYSASAQIEDSNGNLSPVVNENIVKDTTSPLPSFAFFNPANGFGNSGSVSIEVTNILGGDDIFTYSDSSCSSGLLSSDTSGGTSHIYSLTTVTEGKYYFYFTVPNQSGATCFGPLVYEEDLTAPNGPDTISMSSPNNGETSSDATPLFTGTISATENGSEIQVFNNDTCTGTPKGVSNIQQDEFTIGASLALDGSENGYNEFYVRLVDRAGNIGTCLATNLSYTLSNTGLANLPKLAMVGVDSVTKLISLEDNNEITWIKKSDPNNPITFGPLSEGDVIYIEDPITPSEKVDAGDIIESTGATYVVTSGYGTAPWASEAYSGKTFTSYQYRYGNDSKIYVTSLVADSFVQIKQDVDDDGDLDTIDYATVQKNEIVEFSPVIADGKPFQIVSDYSINVYYVSSSNGGTTFDKDARVLTPAATDIIGFSWYITSIENDTTVSAHRHQTGKNFSSNDLDINEVLDVERTLKSNLIDYATRVIADKPVSMLQIADQDGVNASPSLPLTMLATHFGIPANADYIGIIAPTSGNYYYTLPGNAEVGPIALTAPGNTDPNAPHAAVFTNAGLVPAGTLIRCDTPCFMIYDDEELGDEDETLMMGFSP